MRHENVGVWIFKNCFIGGWYLNNFTTKIKRRIWRYVFILKNFLKNKRYVVSELMETDLASIIKSPQFLTD